MGAMRGSVHLGPLEVESMDAINKVKIKIQDKNFGRVVLERLIHP
jgi:hypothetical protein